MAKEKYLSTHADYTMHFLIINWEKAPVRTVDQTEIVIRKKETIPLYVQSP